MAHWKSRIYTCKKYKKSVEIFPDNEYICSACNAPLLSNQRRPYYYIGMNPMARTTKMEFSEQTHEQTMKEFRK